MDVECEMRAGWVWMWSVQLGRSGVDVQCEMRVDVECEMKAGWRGYLLAPLGGRRLPSNPGMRMTSGLPDQPI